MAERFNGDIQVEEFVNPSETKEIVSSQSFRGGDWRSLGNLRGLPSGVHKNVIPVDLTDTRFLVVTVVDPDSTIKAHSHDEAVVRYIVSGSLTLNGQQYGTGEWMIVPLGAEYEIVTATGYTAIVGYGQACDG